MSKIKWKELDADIQLGTTSGVRDDYTVLDQVKNTIDTVKALGGSKEASYALANREQENFGDYGLSNLILDFATFATGAGAGRKALTLFGEKLAGSKVAQIAGETIGGTALQEASSGQLTENIDGESHFNPAKFAVDTVLNAPFEGLFRVKDIGGATAKQIEKDNFIYQDGTYKKNPPEMEQLLQETEVVPTEAINTASYDPVSKTIRVNKELYEKAQNGDKDAQEILNIYIQHELGHFDSHKNGRIKTGKDVPREEYVRHLDTFINAVLSGKFDMADELIDPIQRYNESVGGHGTFVDDFIDYLDNSDELSGKGISELLKKDPIVQEWKGKKNFIYEGTEDLKIDKTPSGVQYRFPDKKELSIGVRSANDPAKLSAWIANTYGVEPPKIEFADFNGFKNGTLYIDKKQSNKEKLISAIHELIHKKDVESGSNPITSPKPAGDTNELFTYASDYILAKRLGDNKLANHSLKQLYMQFEELPHSENKIGTTSKDTIKYILKNIDKQKKLKDTKVDMNKIYDFLSNPTDDKLPSFIDELSKLRKKKLKEEKQDVSLGGSTDVVTQRLMEKYGIDRAEAEKHTKQAITQYDYKKLLKMIDDDTFFEKTKLEPPQTMSKQQRIKNKLFEKLNKSTKDARNVSEENAQRNMASVQYNKIKIEKGYIDKAKKSVEVLLRSKTFREKLRRYILSTKWKQKKRKALYKKLVKEGMKPDEAKAKVQQIVKSDIEKAYANAENLIKATDFFDEFEKNIDIYTEPRLNGNRIEFDKLNTDNVIEYIFENRIKKDLSGKQENKRLSKAEGKANIKSEAELKKRLKERLQKKKIKKDEPPKKEKKEYGERVELRYAKSIDRTPFKRSPIRNSVKVKEYLKAEDYAEKKMGVTYDSKAFAAGGSKYMQAVTAVHEFLHNVYPKKIESEIYDLAFQIVDKMAKESDEFAKRIEYKKTKDFMEPPKEEYEEFLRYVNGNDDMMDILFGKSEVKYSKWDEANDKASEVIDKALKKIGDTDTAKKVKEFIKGNKLLSSFAFEIGAENEFMKALSKWKEEANRIISEMSEMMKSESEKFKKKHGHDIGKFIKSGIFRQFEPNEKILLDEKYAKEVYAKLLKKHKKLKLYIENSDNPFTTHKYSINSVKEAKEIFGDDYADVLSLIARRRLGGSVSKEALNDFKRIANTYNSIDIMHGNDHAIVGYYPHVYETTYDIKIAYTKKDEELLKKQKYKKVGKHVYIKRKADPDIRSALFYADDLENKFGFSKTVTKAEAVEIKKRFGDSVKFRKTNDGKFVVRYEPDKKLLKELISLDDSGTTISIMLYKKLMSDMFNEKVFHKTFKKTLKELNVDESEIISTKPKDGFEAIGENETKFLNKLLKRDEKKYYIKKEYMHYFFNKEILPSNEYLAVAYKVWKSLVAKMKWHLTATSTSAWMNAIVGGSLNLAYIGVNPKKIMRLGKETFEEYKQYKKYMDMYFDIIKNKGFTEAQEFLKKNKKNNTFIEVMLDSSVGSLFENPDIVVGKGRTYFDSMMSEIDKTGVYELVRIGTLDRTTAVGKVLLNKYAMIDLFQRVMAYKYLKTRHGKEKAIQMINDIFVDFGKPQTAIANAFEMTAFPFLTWTLRMQGGLFRVAKNRPLDMAALIGIYITLNYMFDENYDEYAGDIRTESWFIHNVFMDTMLLETNFIKQFYDGRYDKVFEMMAIPKTYEEIIAVSEGKREPLEIIGLNFKPEWYKIKELREKEAL